MKIFIINIIYLVLLFPIASKSQVKLMDDENVREIFSKPEIASLSKIVELFDRVISDNNDNQSINQKYQKYFTTVRKSKSFEKLRTHIWVTNSSEVEELIERLLNESLFNEIWKYEFAYDFKTKDTLSLNLTLNMHGKYLKLLESLGTYNEYLKEYTITIQSSDAITPSLVAGILKVHDSFNFNKEVNRLVWAVHYITISSERNFSGYIGFSDQ